MLGTPQSFHKLGLTTVSLADTNIQLTGHIKLFGVTLDSTLSLDRYVSTVARSCNYQLWSLRHIRHLLTFDVTAALCRCLILSRLDYCNSLLDELFSASLHKLQMIQHKAARVVIGGDVEPTDAMKLLHWLPVPERIKFKNSLVSAQGSDERNAKLRCQHSPRTHMWGVWDQSHQTSSTFPSRETSSKQSPSRSPPVGLGMAYPHNTRPLVQPLQV